MMSMRKLKKISLVFACLLLLTAAVCQIASAAENSTHASLYLNSYGAHLSPGDASGKLYLDFEVAATEISDMVGISKIVIYKSDGTRVTTANGSLANGLLIQNDSTHVGTYTFTVTPGQSYYAVLSVYAARDGGSDTKLYTTNTATAPKAP